MRHTRLLLTVRGLREELPSRGRLPKGALRVWRNFDLRVGAWGVSVWCGVSGLRTGREKESGLGGRSTEAEGAWRPEGGVEAEGEPVLSGESGGCWAYCRGASTKSVESRSVWEGMGLW